MKDFIKIDDLIGAVAAGKRVGARLPIGGRVFAVQLNARNTAAANTAAPANTIYDKIEVEYNGEIIWSTTGPRIDAIQTKDNAALASQAYVGANNGEGERQLTLYFAQPTEDQNNGLAVPDSELGAIPTAMLKAGKELRVWVTFAMGVTPALTVKALVDDVEIRAFQPVRKIEEHPFDATTDEVVITNELPDTGTIAELHFFDTDDGKTVENVKIEIDRKARYDAAKNDQTTRLKGMLMNPAAGCFHVVLADRMAEAPSFKGKNVVATVTLSAVAAGTLTVVSQRWEMPGKGA